MRIRDFLLLVYDALSRRLPKPLLDHEWRIRWGLLNVYFERPTIHYEVWVQKKSGRIEIGLHFEDEREVNERWAQVLAEQALEIQAQLGPAVELEQWTSSWTRLHETVALNGNLTEALARDVAERLARYIEVLEPLMAQERAAVAS